ncbi:MAG: SpoIID/LytB domain-containing protein, partial [Candidatus Eremiobacteraeota bacterium]|nr:SpoIID/LytB domain-containing protein [Candidatus Eremiobacteraeota bacterium]
MRRNVFLSAAAAFAVVPSVARATGGRDVESAESVVSLRVLLASGSFPSPQPLDGWHFAWDGRTYRGTYEIVGLPDGRSGLVNVVPLDAYLYGVLGKEISASWAPGSQQAQAIVSRTYALGKIRPGKPYDVVAAESDQHYGGMEGESVECRAAIDATAAQIVTFERKPARVAYSSCCGGRTAASADVWKTAYPYLTSVADPNCSGAPNFTWTAQIVRDDLEIAFGPRLEAIGALRDVRLDTSDPGARPSGIAFLGSAATFETSPAEFRTVLGSGLVRSTFVRSASFDARGSTVSL